MSDFVGELHLRVGSMDDFDLRAGDFADENGCTVNALADGTAWGNRESLTSVLASMMRDGDQVVGVRYGNRKPTVNLVIEGPDLAAVAATERDLTLRVGKPAELRWLPPDEFAELTVFDVVWSDLDHKMDDRDERRVRRHFTLSFSALPHARPDERTVTPALEIEGDPEDPPTVTTITDGSNLSGWSKVIESGTGISTSSQAVVAGAVRTLIEAFSGSADAYTLMAQRSAVVDTSGTPYVTLRVRAIHSIPSGTWNIRVRIDGENYLPVATMAGIDGYLELTYIVGPHTTFQIRADMYVIDDGSGTAPGGFEVDSITMSSHPPASSTRKQLTRTVTVGGSTRTQGSIQINSGGAALGDVLVMTWPLSLGEGYSPALFPFRATGSARTLDSTLYSGGYSGITTPSTYSVPMSALPIAAQGDECAIWARLRVASAPTEPSTITISAQAWQTADAVGPAIGETVTLDLTTEWNNYALCSMPPSPTALGSAGSVVFTITGVSAGVNVEIDDLYLGPPGGAITSLLNVGTSRLWIDAPSLTQPYGALWAGELANRSDARSAQDAAESWQLHDFAPEGVGMFTACAVDDAAVTVEHYRRFHTHVAAEPL